MILILGSSGRVLLFLQGVGIRRLRLLSLLSPLRRRQALVLRGWGLIGLALVGVGVGVVGLVHPRLLSVSLRGRRVVDILLA